MSDVVSRRAGVIHELDTLVKRGVRRAFEPLGKHGPLRIECLERISERVLPSEWHNDKRAALVVLIEMGVDRLEDQPVQDGKLSWRDMGARLYCPSEDELKYIEGKAYSELLRRVFEDARLGGSEATRKRIVRTLREKLADALLALEGNAVTGKPTSSSTAQSSSTHPSPFAAIPSPIPLGSAPVPVRSRRRQRVPPKQTPARPDISRPASTEPPNRRPVLVDIVILLVYTGLGLSVPLASICFTLPNPADPNVSPFGPVVRFLAALDRYILKELKETLLFLMGSAFFGFLLGFVSLLSREDLKPGERPGRKISWGGFARTLISTFSTLVLIFSFFNIISRDPGNNEAADEAAYIQNTIANWHTVTLDGNNFANFQADCNIALGTQDGWDGRVYDFVNSGFPASVGTAWAGDSARDEFQCSRADGGLQTRLTPDSNKLMIMYMPDGGLSVGPGPYYIETELRPVDGTQQSSCALAIGYPSPTRAFVFSVTSHTAKGIAVYSANVFQVTASSQLPGTYSQTLIWASEALPFVHRPTLTGEDYSSWTKLALFDRGDMTDFIVNGRVVSSFKSPDAPDAYPQLATQAGSANSAGTAACEFRGFKAYAG